MVDQVPFDFNFFSRLPVGIIRSKLSDAEVRIIAEIETLLYEDTLEKQRSRSRYVPIVINHHTISQGIGKHPDTVLRLLNKMSRNKWLNEFYTIKIINKAAWQKRELIIVKNLIPQAVTSEITTKQTFEYKLILGTITSYLARSPLYKTYPANNLMQLCGITNPHELLKALNYADAMQTKNNNITNALGYLKSIVNDQGLFKFQTFEQIGYQTVAPNSNIKPKINDHWIYIINRQDADKIKAIKQENEIFCSTQYDDKIIIHHILRAGRKLNISNYLDHAEVKFELWGKYESSFYPDHDAWKRDMAKRSKFEEKHYEDLIKETA